MMRVGLTYDLREDYLRAGYSELEAAEFDRIDTIEAIESVLCARGFVPVRIGHIRQLAARLVAGERWDLVFNICEGLSGFGREAQVPALLDAYGIPYTFSDPLVSALTLHKGMAKHVVRAQGVATPDFALVESLADIERIDLPLPVFAKPVAEGTGKGVTAASKVKTKAALRRVCARLLSAHAQPVLVEAYLPGREFTVGILGTGRLAGSLGVMEIVLRLGADAEVYSYRNKEHCEELVNYELLRDDGLTAQVEAVALAAWRALGCRDGGRVDIRLDAAGVAHFLEVNPLAGLHPAHSDLPMLAAMGGMSYADLIGCIIKSAMERLDVRQRRRTYAA